MELFQQSIFFKIDFILFLFQEFLLLKVNLKILLRIYHDLEEMHHPSFLKKNYYNLSMSSL
jgi:hypothetical protein